MAANRTLYTLHVYAEHCQEFNDTWAQKKQQNNKNQMRANKCGIYIMRLLIE